VLATDGARVVATLDRNGLRRRATCAPATGCGARVRGRRARDRSGRRRRGRAAAARQMLVLEPGRDRILRTPRSSTSWLGAAPTGTGCG
jgi:hypothetical protein